MNLNQIYSFLDLSYPERLKGNSLSISNKKRAFRELYNNFKLNNIKCLLTFYKILIIYKFILFYLIYL